MRFKRTFTEPVTEARTRRYEEAGINAFSGNARFLDDRTLEAGDDRIVADHFVIASGANELHVATGDEQLLTSETFLELDSLPESLAFIGGGYIAFEFAHIAARAGSHITILHGDAHPLDGFDSDLVEQLVRLSREAGIDVHLETRVEAVQRTGEGVTLRARTSDGPRTFEAREAVLAAGRTPAIDDLDLQAAGVERTAKGIKVNSYLQSVSNARVYAAGDAADGGALALTPVAGYEGEIVASNILKGNAQSPNFRGLVSTVYTIPALASVGLTQAQAQAQHQDVDVRFGDMSTWYSTRHVGSNAAYYKIILEKNTGAVLGASVLGPHAEEQVNVLALAIRYGLSRAQIAETLFAYPTASSDLEHMLG
jgi:glutathione reductase (NADPH)